MHEKVNKCVFYKVACSNPTRAKHYKPGVIGRFAPSLTSRLCAQVGPCIRLYNIKKSARIRAISNGSCMINELQENLRSSGGDSMIPLVSEK